MNINRGYILPVILVVFLLISAGFVLFTDKVSEVPVVKPLIPEISTSTDIVDLDTDIDTQEDTATTTDIDDTQATTSTSTDLEE